MTEFLSAAATASGRVPWNKGKIIGAKPPLRPKHVWEPGFVGFTSVGVRVARRQTPPIRANKVAQRKPDIQPHCMADDAGGN